MFTPVPRDPLGRGYFWRSGLAPVPLNRREERMALQVKPRIHKDGRVYRLAVVIDHGTDKKTKKANREYIYPKVAEYHAYGFDPMWPLQTAFLSR